MDTYWTSNIGKEFHVWILIGRVIYMMPGLVLLTNDLPGKGFPLGRDTKKGARIIFGGKIFIRSVWDNVIFL